MRNKNVAYGSMNPSPFIEHLKEKNIHLCLFNRATYSRCKALINELTKYPNVKLTLVCSSALLMNDYGKAIDYIRRDHMDCKIQIIDEMPQNTSGPGAARLVGRLIMALSDHFEASKPDTVIVVADRFETWAPAIAAKCQNIPVVHIQGGEITGNVDDIVRHSITQMADYHFVSTSCAKEYVTEMGQEFKRIYFTGCPSLDLISKNRIRRVTPKEKYIISIFHPETELIHKAYEQTRTVMEAVLEYCYQYGYKCYWYYPNPDPGRTEITRYLDDILTEHNQFIIKAVNLEPEAFLSQLAGARIVVGNSSCGIRECSRIGVPVVNIGQRQRLRERSINVMDVDYDKDKILKIIKKQHEIQKYFTSKLYGDGGSTLRIAEYLARIDYSLKGHLTYPLQAKFREQHFGENRLIIQEKERRA